MSAVHSFHRVIISLMLVISLCWPCQVQALTIGEERLIGQKILYSVRRDLRILDDPDISQYINRLGTEVLQVVGPQYFDYRFFVVQSEQFNAFAAPAGLVFFYSGLIEAMHNEDELVSVLAHEIGHVASRHLAQRMDKGAKVGAASLLLGLAGLALGVPGLSQGLLTGSLAAGQAINLHYSREDEEQADRLSFGWMQKMRRNPEAMRGMLQTMRRITRYRVGNIPQYLLTHPNPEARLDYVESLIELDRQSPQPTPWEETDNFAFLRFRYRVLLQTTDLERLRQYCTITLAQDKDADTQRMARFGLALIEAENRRFEQALAQLAIVQGQYPHKNILKVDEAVILQRAGRIREAKNILEASVLRNPTEYYGLFQLARAEAVSGNTVRAETLFQQVAQAMPEYPQVYFELGQMEANRGRTGMSIFYLGKYYLYQGREDLAVQNLRRASKDTSIPKQIREQAKQILAELEHIKKET
ncbi:MAG: M48 family metalloprotease [Desulfobulbaceae bacterium]|nr:M48 family metalloprotease [Desulfobulbaceae bacterium]